LTTATVLIICTELHFATQLHAGEISLNQADSVSSSRPRHWLTSCNLLYACLCEARPGCHLTTLFGSTAVMPITVQNAVPKKKRTLVPLLTVVFLFSYGLMTMLIVEQGSVIQSQRNLIKILMTDSTELWSMKGKAVLDQQTARAKTQGHAPVPSAQTPTTQTPSAQTPSAQAAPQLRSQGHTGRIGKAQPQHPPVPAADLIDQRRALRTI
jgi:hypothetical protein